MGKPVSVQPSTYVEGKRFMGGKAKITDAFYFLRPAIGEKGFDSIYCQLGFNDENGGEHSHRFQIGPAEHLYPSPDGEAMSEETKPLRIVKGEDVDCVVGQFLTTPDGKEGESFILKTERNDFTTLMAELENKGIDTAVFDGKGIGAMAGMEVEFAHTTRQEGNYKQDVLNVVAVIKGPDGKLAGKKAAGSTKAAPKTAAPKAAAVAGSSSSGANGEVSEEDMLFVQAQIIEILGENGGELEYAALATKLLQAGAKWPADKKDIAVRKKLAGLHKDEAFQSFAVGNNALLFDGEKVLLLEA